jgi:hypothetical protein
VNEARELFEVPARVRVLQRCGECDDWEKWLADSGRFCCQTLEIDVAGGSDGALD